MAAVTVVPFCEREHLGAAVDVLLRVREADPSYPPPQDAEATVEGFTAWLLAEPVLGRWVALRDGEVAGHVQVATAHAYLVEHLQSSGASGPVAEVGKLFVDPRAHREGAGSALLATACAFAWERRLRPGLAVLATSGDAILLYRHAGMQDAGSFFGVHGKNLVMLAPPPATTPGRGAARTG